MTKGRLEAFTDGVIAIIITIMVLELKAPHSTDLGALKPLLPVFLSYLLSFIYVGIYWNNHHHLFHAVHRISGATLWTNLHLLFWLSLIPFATSWMGENHFGAGPVALYGAILLMCAAAWEIQRRVLLQKHRPDSALARALGNRRRMKEWLSLLVYAAGIGIALSAGEKSAGAWIACGLYAMVASMWLIPDRRIAREIETAEPDTGTIA